MILNATAEHIKVGCIGAPRAHAGCVGARRRRNNNNNNNNNKRRKQITSKKTKKTDPSSRQG
jgi:hypothetical protein